MNAGMMGTAAQHCPQAMSAIHAIEHDFVDEFSLALMETTLELHEQDLSHYEQSMCSKEVAVRVCLLMGIQPNKLHCCYMY